MAHRFPTWAKVKEQTHDCLRHVCEWCRDTWHRITHDAGYAEAVAALLLSATELFVRGELGRRFLTELVHAFLAVIRSLLREGPDLDEGYWA